MSEKINTNSIIQFIQTVKSADLSHHKEIHIDIATAKQLSYTLSLIMTRLVGDYETLLTNPPQEVINISMDGGNWG